jgi:hypothetical protein
MNMNVCTREREGVRDREIDRERERERESRPTPRSQSVFAQTCVLFCVRMFNFSGNLLCAVCIP